MLVAYRQCALLLLTVMVMSVCSEDYCAASSTIHTELNGLYSYPVDIFNSEMLGTLSSASRIIACNSEGIPQHHKCAKDYSSCPITKEIVELATRRSGHWMSPGHFCQLRDALSNYDEEVNIIIFGGSVTVGHEAVGCHCAPGVQANCQFSGFRPNQEDKESAFWTVMEYCRWALHFVRGYRSLALAKVNIYNFAQGGVESGFSANIVLERFERFKLKPSGKDIILIDHSTNDAGFIHDEATAHTVIEGVENLVRNLYHFSEHASPPLIVLLAQFPQAGARGDLPYDYQHLYSTVAEHYRIPIWSLRDAMTVLARHTNTTTATSAAESLYVPYIRNERNKGGGIHPPWFVHLYMADLYLAILKTEMARCFADPSLIKPPVAISGGEDSTDQLLPDRVVNTTMHYCGLKTTYALEIFSTDVLNQHPVTGVYVPGDGFALVTERNGKVGWVSELASPQDTHMLTFEFPAVIALQSGHASWLLDIQYLRTYENAGVAQVLLCGNPVEERVLDGLWAEPAKFRFSETATFSAQVNISKYCVDAANADAQGSAGRVFRLQIVHRTTHCDGLDGTGSAQTAAMRCAARRTTQKIKINAVTMCAL